ncbi:MAG: acetyltransferase [Gammaproteobacteria bacterium]
MNEDEQRALAVRMRDACVAAAQAGYEDASIAGLCAEGAMEAAVSAIQKLDIDAVLKAPHSLERQHPAG